MPKERKSDLGVPDEKYGLKVCRGYYNGSAQYFPEDYSLRADLDAPQCCAVSHMKAHGSWLRKLETAIRRSCEFLFETQHQEGYWWAELEANVTITSEYLMFFHILGSIDHDREERMVRHLLHEQRENGAWGLYYGDGGDLSTTIEAYFALKLAGVSADSPPMQRARRFILARGGIESSRVFTKIWLALFSQYPWNKIPSMPVELVLLPARFLISIYEFSSWARSTVVPLSIIMAIRPHREPAPEFSVAELYSETNLGPAHASASMALYNVFRLIDRGVKWVEKHHPAPRLREKAFRAAEEWILDHQEETGDWGGIQPCMINSIMALHFLGYAPSHPVIDKGLAALRSFCFEDENGLRLQSCISPVWDTGLNCIALKDAGIPVDDPRLHSALSWLVRNQIHIEGDWQVKNDHPPGGWAFEFANTHFPDVDDSAVVLMALHGSPPVGSVKDLDANIKIGLDWCLSMQCTSGGWAAFDKNNTMTALNQIPFADHEAMVDYPTADITGRMLEVMGTFGMDRFHPKARKGIEFIRKSQESDGSWWGRWGVNYIYGTWSVLRGLIAIGEAPDQPYIQAAIRWLKSCQNPDGGWGETCESYRRPELRGQGPSTPSQTAWALLGLIAAGEHDSPEVELGIRHLLRHQKQDGSWEEAYFTGTGFPKHFFIRYHNYRNCFPLMAIARYKELRARELVAL